jgi:hypothetical protein
LIAWFARRDSEQRSTDDDNHCSSWGQICQIRMKSTTIRKIEWIPMFDGAFDWSDVGKMWPSGNNKLFDIALRFNGPECLKIIQNILVEQHFARLLGASQNPTEPKKEKRTQKTTMPSMT